MHNWSIDDDPSAEELAVISDGVVSYGRAEAAGGDPRPIACFRDDGRVVAGGSGRTEFARLFVLYLWVLEELRGSGLGSQVLARLERAAQDRGCKDVLIETLSDRTAGLYARLGYAPIATIAGYVGPFNKHIMLKTF